MMATGLGRDGAVDSARSQPPSQPRRTIMPLITVTYSSFRKAPSLKAEIASAVSDLTAEILHKDPKVTAVILKTGRATDWFAGGTAPAGTSPPRLCVGRHPRRGTTNQGWKA